MDIKSIVITLNNVQSKIETHKFTEALNILKLQYGSLQAEHPTTVRLMKSVHYANTFVDLNLKDIAYLLDEFNIFSCKFFLSYIFITFLCTYDRPVELRLRAKEKRLQFSKLFFKHLNYCIYLD